MAKDKSAFLLINMARSKDRLEQCSQILAQHRIQYTRIEGVDGSQLSHAQLNAVKAPEFSGYYKVLSKGEIGCYLSHKKCWEYIVKHQLEYAIILEDDFIANDKLANIHDYIDAINMPWDAIKLMAHQDKRKVVLSVACLNKQLVRYNKIPSCTLAYVISNNGAKKMLSHSQKISRPVDIDFQYWWESNMMIYGLKPYMVSVNWEQESTIDIDRKHENIRKNVVQQFMQKFYFEVNNKKHLRRLHPHSK